MVPTSASYVPGPQTVHVAASISSTGFAVNRDLELMVDHWTANRLRLPCEIVSVQGRQKPTHASCTDSTEALNSNVLGSLRRAAVARREEALGEAWVLCLCTLGFDCRPDYYSSHFSGSPPVVFSASTLPTGKMPQVGPRLHLEARHAFWI